MEINQFADLDHVAILRGIWRRRKRLFLLIFFGLAIPGMVAVYFSNGPAYVSQGTIAVELPLLDQMPQFRDFGRRDSIATLLILLKSRSFGEAVVEALPKESFEELITNPQYTDYTLILKNRIKLLLGMSPTVYSPQERAAVELQNARMTFVQSPQLPTVLTIVGTASRPRVAMDLVNTHIQVLLTQSRSISQEELRRGRESLEAQLEKAKESLVKGEQNLAKYQQQKGRTTFGGQTELDLDKLSQAEAALVEAEASRDVLWAEMAVLRQSLNRGRDKGFKGTAQNQGADTDDVTAASPRAESLARLNAFKTAQERLARLEEKLSALRDRYTEAHPSVQATQKEVTNEQARVAQLARDLPTAPTLGEAQGPKANLASPTDRAELQRQLATLGTQEAAIQARIEKLKMQVNWQRNNLQSLSQEAVDLGNLRRTVEVNRSLVGVLTDKLMAARVHEQGQDRPVRVVVPALFPSRPTQSETPKYSLVALVLAGIMAFGVAFGIEFWYQPLETEKEVQKVTGLSVLGSMAIIKKVSLIPEKTSGSGHLARLPISLPQSSNNAKIPLELYRAIRANIETERLKAPFRSILINSPGPGEGKSTTVVNLAYVFQALGRRVLVVEADLRLPSIHRLLSVPNKPGLADYLIGAATIEQVCRILPSGVTFIPGQTVREDPASVLASARLKELLDPVNSQFDLVLVDSAPILAVPDTLSLVTTVDRVILVVKASSTSKRELRKAQLILQKANANILGIIVNQANRRDVDYYHPRYRKYYGPTDGRPALEAASRSSLVSQRGKK